MCHSVPSFLSVSLSARSLPVGVVSVSLVSSSSPSGRSAAFVFDVVQVALRFWAVWSSRVPLGCGGCRFLSLGAGRCAVVVPVVVWPSGV